MTGDEGPWAGDATEADADGTEAGGATRTDDPGTPTATRRGVVASLVGGGTAAAALSPLAEVLGRVAPLSGAVWRATGDGPTTVDSPYGPATVTYDDYHVPHVEAETEPSAYFAVGYVHAADRLSMMDVYRRRAEGTLADVFGSTAVEQDVFARKMDFEGAARASETAIADTPAATAVEAYAAGASRYVREGSPGTEFGLLDYEPSEWAVLDSLLVMARFAWQLSGRFDALRRSVTRRAFDESLHERLYPERFDHDAPILRGSDSRPWSVDHSDRRARPEGSTRGSPPGERVDPGLVDWLGRFEAPKDVGSNAWTVSGEYTDSGAPILASDPHLALRAPPLLYEQRVTVGDHTVRGVTVPGVPFVIIGETDDTAWGLTNADNADVIDCYSYDVDGDHYRYRGEWRAFETATETVEVARGRSREVEVRKTVHGPYLDPDVPGDDGQVAVAWTQLTGTRELQAFYELERADGADAVETAVRKFDGLPVNVHYADGDDNTGYRLAGKIPVRRVDGEVVPADRVFDGSAGEAEWAGFEPYGQSTWEGVVPYEDKPGVRDPDYVASANQRFADEPDSPFADRAAPGFRAERIYERLDAAAEAGTTMDREFVADVQLDTLDLRARSLVPPLLDARDRMPDDADPWLDALAEWDYRMDRDSRAALAFAVFLDRFSDLAWGRFFDEYDLGRSYWPDTRVLLDLPADSEVFDGDRASVMADAMQRALDAIDSAGWERYGDYNVTAIDHVFGWVEPGLNYPRLPTDGSARTVRAFTPANSFGASYRLVADLGGETVGVLPGGNDGEYGSDHYHDQLRLWADGEYKRLDRTPSGDPDATFEEGDE